jgi:integrase
MAAPPDLPVPSDAARQALALARAYRDEADSRETLRAYATDLLTFRDWCAQAGLTPMPATPEVVGAFLAATGHLYALGTLRRRVAAIARANRLAGHMLDTRAPAIRETLRAIARKHGAPPKRALALVTDDIRALIGVCGRDLAGMRDAALLLVGFAAALRRSELVSLDLEHITWTREGMELLVARSKTDAAGEGARLGIPRGRSAETCPVRALQRWIDRAGIAYGPLFRKVNRWGGVEETALVPDAVRHILLKRAKQAGLSATLWERLSPHSLRAGFITAAYKAGVADEEIMAHSRHRSVAVMRKYVRRAKLSADSPAGKVGL